MSINFISFASLLTFIGLFIFVWTPTVESKGGGTGYKPSKQPNRCDRICTWKKQQEKGRSSNSGSSSGGTGSSRSGYSADPVWIRTGSCNGSAGIIFQNIMKKNFK